MAQKATFFVFWGIFVSQMIQDVQESRNAFIEWHDIYRMPEAQKLEKLMGLADSLAKILETPILKDGSDNRQISG